MLTKENLQTIFQSKYNAGTWQNLLINLFGGTGLRATPEQIDGGSTEAETAFYLGEFTENDENIGLFYYKINKGSVVHKRVGLRNLVKTFTKKGFFDAVLAVFDDGIHWRVSFISDIKGDATSPKRYTFVFGDADQYYHTAIERFLKLKNDGVSFRSLMDAFSVDALTKEFFNNYKSHYLLFCEYLLAKYKASFNSKDDYKEVRDFCKKLLGRIVFLYFLQKKGWLGAKSAKYTDGNKNFMSNLFNAIKENDTFYSEWLSPLFFETLNKVRPNDDFRMPDGTIVKIPFLNGGLFENDFSTDKIINFPHKLFKDLFEFYDQYNFTIYEDDPNDHTVAVDPEMLGHIFENLLEDNKDKGTFYTPKEIVHHMCKESLVEYLRTSCGAEHEQAYRDLLNGDPQMNTPNTLQKKIEVALDNVKICDPAIGSGAFPMGLLQEIYNAKLILTNLQKTNKIHPADIKRQIIQNSIYGVDIEKGAVDIARLRFWLSLIIDENLPTPLPNLDYKIMQGNSLIEEFGGVDLSDLMEDSAEGISFKSMPGSQTAMFEKAKQGFLSFEEKNELQKMMQIYFDFESSKQKSKYKDKSEIKNKIDKFVIERLSARFDKEIQKILNDIQELTQLIAKNAVKATDTKGVADRKQKAIERLKKTMGKEAKSLDTLQKNLDRLTQMQHNPNSENSFFLWKTWFRDVFANAGFDIVVGNPPYVSTKGVSSEDKVLFERAFGFSDDTYNHFFFKGFDLLKPDGVLTYIVPKTFWTTQTKRNLRDLLLSKTVKYIFDTANPFQSAMVDTCIISVKNNKPNNNQILFLDGKESLIAPEKYTIEQGVYLNTQNSVIFKPTPENLRIHELYGQKIKDLYNEWWDKISTSRNIENNKEALETYRKKLKPGDVALLGCLTEGGQGLATANNGRYIAVRKSTKWATNILKSRPKKLADAIKMHKIKIWELNNFDNTTDFLNSLTEPLIAELFDLLKEKYGRDIFGQGYIYRLIDDSEIADVDSLTDEEKQNGISETKNFYVPYDKGDKDGNRWYLETPFAIAWSQKNVGFLKANSGKKGVGMPVVRNPQFYFKEGFCWSDINTTFLKCRKKQKSINDVKSMSLYSLTDIVPEYYVICLINSNFMSYYVDNFVNNTQTFQINDARQLPIHIPTAEQLLYCKPLYERAVALKQNNSTDENELYEVEQKLNSFVEELYYSV